MAIDKTKIYSLEEAVKILKENAKAKFDESVEVHLRLGIDPKRTEHQIRATMVLPHGTGKKKKIAAFVNVEKVAEAKKAGADLVGGVDLIEEIKKTQKCDFDIAVAEPVLMKDLAQIARILGPKGLMPSPKSETVTSNIVQAIKDLKTGKISFKSDNTSNLHQLVGKISWPENKLKENITELLNNIKKARPAGVKGNFIKTITLCTTMGPGVKIDWK